MEAKPPPLPGGRGGSRRAGWPSRLDLRRLPSFMAEATESREVGEPVGRADWISPQRSPGSPAPDNGRAAGVVKIACWATYWAWLASIRTKSVRIDALDLTLLRAFHNARPCPTLSRLRTQCAEPHLRIGPRPTEDPPCIPSSCRTLAS